MAWPDDDLATIASALAAISEAVARVDPHYRTLNPGQVMESWGITTYVCNCGKIHGVHTKPCIPTCIPTGAQPVPITTAVMWRPDITPLSLGHPTLADTIAALRADNADLADRLRSASAEIARLSAANDTLRAEVRRLTTAPGLPPVGTSCRT